MTLSRTHAFRVLALLLRIALGAIFVYAAWSKLKDPWALFAMAIDSYQVLPVWEGEKAGLMENFKLGVDQGFIKQMPDAGVLYDPKG